MHRKPSAQIMNVMQAALLSNQHHSNPLYQENRTTEKQNMFNELMNR
jgi:hypothetical protein